VAKLTFVTCTLSLVLVNLIGCSRPAAPSQTGAEPTSKGTGTPATGIDSATSRPIEATVPKAKGPSAQARAADPVLFVLKGHAGGATSVAFSPDGKLLAVGCNDGSVKVWDTASGDELRRWQAHDGTYCRVAFSPDGKTLATGCGSKFVGPSDRNIRLWNVETGEEMGSLAGHQGGINAIAFSPDGKILLSGGNPILGGRPGEARLWDLATLTEIESLKGHKDSVVAVAFSPDGDTFATGGGSFASGVHVWDTATRKELFIGGGTEFVYSPDGKQLISLQGDNIVFSDSSNGKVVDTIAKVDTRLYRLAVSKDGKTLSVSGKGSANGPRVALWDVNQTKEKAVIEGHFRDIVVGLAFSPDGRTLATGSLDTRVTIWDVENLPKPTRRSPGGE
jgi:WD40 repeat protein